MTITGKADDFIVEEPVAFGNKYQITKPREIIQRTVEGAQRLCRPRRPAERCDPRDRGAGQPPAAV